MGLKAGRAPTARCEVAIQYGAFINTLIQFLDHRVRDLPGDQADEPAEPQEEEAPAAPPADVVLLTEIRDLLKNRQ